MGRRTERSRSYISDAAKNLKVQQREDERRFNEQSLAEAERLLGTDAQIAGQLGGSPEMSPFLGRYNLNRAYAESTLDILSRGNQVRDGLTISQLLDKNVGEANELLNQAQQAAEAGDFALANQLKAQAEDTVDSGNYYPIIDTAAAQQAITYGHTDTTTAARDRLSSPSAQAVGSMVQQARGFLDPNSEVSQRFKENLNINAQRSIASERRSAERAIRDTALGAGGSRSASAFAALQARTSDRFALAEAKLLSQTSQYFEEYSRAFSMDALKFSQAWLQGTAGFREQYQTSMDNLTTLVMDGYRASSALAGKFSGESAEMLNRSKERTQSLMTAVAGLAAGVLTGGAALPALAGTAASMLGGGGGSPPTQMERAAEIAGVYKYYKPQNYRNEGPF